MSKAGLKAGQDPPTHSYEGGFNPSVTPKELQNALEGVLSGTGNQ